MKNFKTISFYVFVAISIGAAAWGYLYLKQTKKPSLNASDVLPDQALCVMSSSNFHELTNKLTNKNLIWNELVTIPEFKSINRQLQYFDSLATEVDEIKSFLEGKQIYLSVYQRSNTITSLIAFNLKDLMQEPDFLLAIKNTLKCEFSDTGEGEYWDGTTRLNIKITQGVVLISENKDLINECFSSETKKQSANTSYKSLSDNLDDNNLFNVYLNHELLKKSNSKINTNELLFTGRSVCNIEITPDAITANGFNDCDSTSILNYLVGQPAQNSDFFQALPFNTIAYKAIALGNFSHYQMLLKQDRLSTLKFWKNANDSALFNVERQFTENIDTKVIEAEYKVNSIKNKALVIEIKDSALIKETLSYLADSVFQFQSQEAYRLRTSDGILSEIVFGKLFNVQTKYAFVYGNYLVLSEDADANLFYIYSMMNNSSVAQNEVFMNYAKDNLLVSFNYQIYYAINKNVAPARHVLSFLSDSSVKSLNKLSDLSLNFTNYKNLLQFRTNVKYQSASQGKTIQGLWTCEADTIIRTKPMLFKNHKSNENELVFQDEKNNLYLVNATGNILWKKQIGEASISDFYMVDAFKNNKFQLLFNTANYIHLIDRNGHDVPGYPVKLPAKATNAMSLFDYEQTKDYRILLACADLKIYNYNISGIKNEKFAPIPLDNNVTTKVKYVKVGGSDYLIANDVEGKIYVYSRRGEGRIDLSNKLVTDSKDFYVDATNNIQNTKLIYFDAKNSLLENITLVDKKDILKIGSDFENASYYFDWIDDDKKVDLIILDKSKLLCFDMAGNELFNFESIDDSYTEAQYFYDTDGAFFILNHVNDEIQVLDISTKKITKKIKGNGTPLLCDLFQDGKKYIIVSEGNSIKCVLFK